MTENSLKKVRDERNHYRVGQREKGRKSHHFKPKPQSFKGKQV